MEQKPITAIIVGAGHRALIYADLARTNPELLQIVGVADPNPQRRKNTAKLFGFSEENCFDSAEALARVPKFADAVINGTMDHQHVQTAIPLLEAGYDMLLEKPFAVNEAEMRTLIDCVKQHGRKVMICHVLRYTPFYYGIKERVQAGEIGDILHIQTTEYVSYHHLSTSYVRGKWGKQADCHTSMLLAKCSHDLDIMMWLMNETKPERLTSFGSLYQFKPENAPEGAGERCMADCPLVEDCRYSAKRLYLDQPLRWSFYVWDELEHLSCPDLEDMAASLAGSNPYGRCIYKCGNDVVDHQTVQVQFASGATGVHSMVGGSSTSLRQIRLTGTEGEIYGNFEEGKFIVAKIHPTAKEERTVEEVDLSTGGLLGGHGGGDEKMTADFVAFLRDEAPSLACTTIFDSIPGHLCVYLADQSMAEGGAPQAVTY